MSVYTLSVSQLNEYVSKLLRRDVLLRDLGVRGEISDLKRHPSEHVYFTLKDEGALLRCVMFKPDTLNLTFRPENGMLVTAYGYAGVYPAGGQYQLYVRNVEKQNSEGELFKRFCELKEKLKAEGLFNEEHKKPLPTLPRRIGVVTSETGAVFHDIMNVTRRRFPNMGITLCPARVQGEGAAEEIARAIRYMDEKRLADVIIVGRGGGSMDDLWAFNEETVARAVYDCATPIISAVGHETDFTICDFVADVRASTPSMAAELCVPMRRDLDERIAALASLLGEYAARRINMERLKLDAMMRSDGAARVGYIIDAQRQRTAEMFEQIATAVQRKAENARAEKVYADDVLKAFDPRGVLKRGYAVVKRDGSICSGVEAISTGDSITVVMNDGSVGANVTEVNKNGA